MKTSSGYKAEVTGTLRKDRVLRMAVMLLAEGAKQLTLRRF
jgi:hypothetical protein